MKDGDVRLEGNDERREGLFFFGTGVKWYRMVKTLKTLKLLRGRFWGQFGPFFMFKASNVFETCRQVSVGQSDEKIASGLNFQSLPASKRPASDRSLSSDAFFSHSLSHRNSGGGE